MANRTAGRNGKTTGEETKTAGLKKFFTPSVSQKEILFFLDHLRVMLKAGITLSESLKTLAKQSKNKQFAKIITELSGKVDRGVSFADALRNEKGVFNELFINMIEAGEVSGGLENVLAQLYFQVKKNYALRSKVRSALTYPTVIMIAMLGIGAFMIVFVVPKITAMFKEFDAELPLATKILIAVSDTIAQNGALFLLGFFVFVIGFWRLLKTEKGRTVFETTMLNFPIIAPIVKKINIARLSRTLSSLLKSDIMIVNAFRITANVVGNRHYRKALLDASDKIKKGEKIADALKNYPKLFTPVIIEMVGVGEETGELDAILGELAEFYEAEVDQTMESLPSIIEPLIILILGCGIGAMAVAIIMPMYSLTSAV